MENKKKKILHIAIIVVGMLFILVGALHKNMWFDETYSVALVKHSFSEIWRIGGNDVHPVLYYMLLKVVNIISGGSVIAYRLFSALGIAILGILGFTHIRKDFGEKTGMFFSFFAFFLPVIPTYAAEIRMYSWAAVFVTLTGIYAYRLIKNSSIKNWILFGIFSLCSLYTHYYGLMAAGLINVLLFIYFIKRKQIRLKYLKPFLITGFLQFLAYIPWLYCMYVQIKNVSKGFWITLSFPGTLFEIMEFQCLGNFDERVAIILAFSLFAIAFSTMYRLRIVKNKENGNIFKNIWKKICSTENELNPGKQAIIVYILVIIAAAVLSIKSPILYPRYLFSATGLLIFFWSYFLSKTTAKKATYVLCAFIVIASIYSNVKFALTNYDSTNMTQIEYMKENLQQGDTIIFRNQELNTGSVIDVNFDGYDTYFYDAENWNVEKAYEAYSPDMKIIHSLDDIQNVNGRIWIIDSANFGLYNEMSEKYNINLIQKETINTKFKEHNYNFVLIEK